MAHPLPNPNGNGKGKGLTKGERRNLYVFLVVLFVVGNIYLVDFLRQQYLDTSRNLRKLHADLAYSQGWLAGKDLWTKRAAWLAATQPKLDDPGQGSARLLETLQQAAKKENLTISAQTLQEPRGATFYKEVAVQITVAGSLEGLCRWLVDVEQPELFQAVTRFSLKCDTVDPTRMRCEMTVARWHSLK